MRGGGHAAAPRGRVTCQDEHLTAEDVRACLAYGAEVLLSEKVAALPR